MSVEAIEPVYAEFAHMDIVVPMLTERACSDASHALFAHHHVR